MTSTSKSIFRTLFAVSTLFAWTLHADVAPDPTDTGPLATASAEYRFAAALDPDIIGDRVTELWASVYRPDDLSSGPYPVLIFLHGNHATCGTGSNPRIDTNCQYTTIGTCPAGYVIAPSHAGYAYLGAGSK